MFYLQISTKELYIYMLGTLILIEKAPLFRNNNTAKHKG